MRDEAVTAARQGLDKTGAFRGISQRFADLVDRYIQSLIEINKCVAGPDLVPKLVAGDDSAVLFQQRSEYLEWLILQTNLRPILAKLPAREVGFEDSKPDQTPRLVRRIHQSNFVGESITSSICNKSSGIG
jgi:hypothetical protein